MEIRSKELEIRVKAHAPEESDLQIINSRFALEPLSPEQVYVRKIHLCNDQVDRTGERFPHSYLSRFQQTLPGKSLLACHDKRSLPIGRFYNAAVEKDDQGVEWLMAWLYMVKTAGNQEMRDQIDGGVLSHASIGFRWADLLCDVCSRSYFSGDCSHLIGQEYEGRAATATYGGDLARVEAVEGSLVYLGAQYGSVLTKSDDRRGEKQLLAGLGAGPDPGLTADGRAYRAWVRSEISRLSGAIGAGQEAALLLEGKAADAPAAQLLPILDLFRARFDATFPAVTHQPAAPDPGGAAHRLLSLPE